MNIRRIIIISVFFSLLIIAVAAGALWRNRLAALTQNRLNKENESLTIVATTYPLYDFTMVVVGDAPGVVVKNLLPFSVGPHDFTPTPETTATINAADVIIKNGLGFDSYADKLIKSGTVRGVIIDTSVRAKILFINDAPDPHLWLNLQNAIVQVEHIRDALIAINPTNKNIYEQNAGRYTTRLNQLDSEYEQTLQKINQKKFVSYHSAFRYLAGRYGLEEVAMITPVAGREPTAQELAATSEIIKQQKIKTIFSEPQFSPKIIESLAADLGVKILSLDPIETGGGEDNYIKIMRRNLETLKNGLQ